MLEMLHMMFLEVLDMKMKTMLILVGVLFVLLCSCRMIMMVELRPKIDVKVPSDVKLEDSLGDVNISLGGAAGNISAND